MFNYSFYDPIAELHKQYESLRRSEKKVADWVLSEPASCINLNIGQMARKACVSEPTVMRFCKAIGCQGFQDFKLRLAQALGTGSATRFAGLKLNKNDNTNDLKNKVFDSTVQELLQVRDRINMNRLQSAISALATARRIEFFGFGASGAVARDARHKFIRLQATAVACASSYPVDHRVHHERAGCGGGYFTNRSLQRPASPCPAGPGKSCPGGGYLSGKHASLFPLRFPTGDRCRRKH